MDKAVQYKSDDRELGTAAFLALVQQVWPGTYSAERTRAALARTLNVTAWDGDCLVGCVRLLTDGYLFGTVTEILVLPEYRRRGVGSKLMELAWEASPTSLFLGAQPGKEPFFEQLGYQPSLASYHRKKPRQK
ncbi:N-acetyltransferase [Paenibacillus sp. J31TS4]|uniref:GNAT family N-acetyltransferase n=1 Tax=Paenibacillus sp. J31TS4 TaxID=2807195 RepID=UPI001B0D08D9|nr:GNAT family N-acetyltransferase [Paenibacillus sp. J31TS4]GIP37761.1 N-acetyltransferase [Paenibacillus sp. J31TS4]